MLTRLRNFAGAAVMVIFLLSAALPAWHTRVQAQQTVAARDLRAYFATVRKQPAALRTFLRGMPKGAELHSHLSGTPTPERLLEIAATSKRLRYYVRIPKQPAAPTDPLAYAFVPAPLDGPPPQEEAAEYVLAAMLLNPQNEAQRAHLAAYLRAHKIEPNVANPLDLFYGAIFQRRGAAVGGSEIVPQLVIDAVRQAHRDRISYIELQLSPFPIEPGESFEEVSRSVNLTDAREHLRLLVAAAKSENDRYPVNERVEVRFILAFSRTSSRIFIQLPLAFELAASTDAVAAHVAGINIVGNEYSRDQRIGQEIAGPEHLRDYLLTLRRVYPTVRFSIHAGEGTRWDWHIRDSLLMGAERIGHATNLMVSPNKTEIELMRRNRILIEACLTSNQLLLGVPLERHPFLSFLRAGIPVSLNTDDAGIFSTDMTEEFARAVEHHPTLTWEELKQLARASLDYAFVSESLRQSLIARWEADMREFEGKITTETQR